MTRRSILGKGKHHAARNSELRPVLGWRARGEDHRELDLPHYRKVDPAPRLTSVFLPRLFLANNSTSGESRDLVRSVSTLRSIRSERQTLKMTRINRVYAKTIQAAKHHRNARKYRRMRFLTYFIDNSTAQTYLIKADSWNRPTLLLPFRRTKSSPGITLVEQRIFSNLFVPLLESTPMLCHSCAPLSTVLLRENIL